MVQAPSLLDPPQSRYGSLNRQLRRWFMAKMSELAPIFIRAADQTQANRYRKHFFAEQHAWLLLFHGLSGLPSLHQSSDAFSQCPRLLERSGLTDGGRLVSFPQYAASNTPRPAAFLAELVAVLVQQIRQHAPAAPRAIPPELQLLDGTFLRLSLKLAPWLPSVKTEEVSAVRVHLQYAPAWSLPEQVLVTDTHVNDVMALDELLLENPAHLTALREQTLVVDLGYYSHRRFLALIRAGVHVVTRLQEQAKVSDEVDLPIQTALPLLPSARITVQRDQRITLGSPNNRAGAVLPGMRLVTALVDPTPKAAKQGAEPLRYQLITDRWDLASDEVVQLYLWRWQIELFFRWLKQHLHLPRLLGYSRNAVELSVWVALLVHLLCLLAAHALGLRRVTPRLRAQLPWILAQLETIGLPQLSARQLALGDGLPLVPF